MKRVVLRTLLIGRVGQGNLFRYDTTTSQYIFNLDTSPLTIGTWQLQVQLDDGKSYNVNISIKS